MDFFKFFVGIFLLYGSTAAFSNPAPPSREGPTISHSQTGFGKEDRDYSSTPAGLRSNVATTIFRFAYPVTVGPLLFLPLIVAIEDTRQLSLGESQVKKILPTHSRVISPGVVVITDTGVNGFRGFVKVGQFQAMRTPEPAGVMREIAAGLAWEEPGSPKDSPLTAKLAFRHREYPHGRRTLLVAGVEKWFSEQNMGLDIQYPSHALFKYNCPEVGLFAVGTESDGIQMPIRFDGEPAWAEGYHGRAIGAFTAPIWKFVYVEVKGGIDRQIIKIFDRTGRTVEEIKVGTSSFVSLAIQTLF